MYDILGKKFNSLTVIRNVGSNARKERIWECKCACGKLIIATSYCIRTGHTKSCGCASIKKLIERSTTHGLSKTPEYKTWTHIKERCNNPKCRQYYRYGGRGIFVCKQWINDFQVFLKDMGNRPTAKHTIERINNDLGYSPDNCKWATDTEQANNKRTTVRITFIGITMSKKQWSDFTGIKPATISKRIKAGWPIENVLLKKVQ